MATRKDKRAAPAGKPASRQPLAGASAPAAMPGTTSSTSSQRLLREAAWSRMFGRAESRNPFARSR